MTERVHSYITVWFLCAFAVVEPCLGCEPGLSQTLKEKTEVSHLVVMGNVTRKFSNTSYQLTVLCVLKDNGSQVNEILNITGVADINSARCFRNHLEVDKEYIMFLRKVFSSYRPVGQEESTKELSSLLQTCSLEVISPYPKSRTHTRSCLNPTSACTTVNTAVTGGTESVRTTKKYITLNDNGHNHAVRHRSMTIVWSVILVLNKLTLAYIK